MCKTSSRSVVMILVLGLALTSVVRADLVGWWKFDDGSGTTARDSTTAASHATLQGNPQWVAGQMGGALRLDGVDDYVQLPIGQLISTLADSTIAMWVNFSGQGGAWQRVFDFGTGTANYIYFCPRDGGGLMHAAITANTGIWTDLTVNAGALPTGWHHLALTLDGKAKNMKILLDSQVVAEAPTLYVLSDLGNTNQNWLGRSQYADPYFNGTLDDFRIYNQVLSPAELRKVMQGEMAAGSKPNPPDKATDVPPDAVLSWKPGEFAKTHDVYLGTVAADVQNAGRANSLGVLASQGQDANAYDPAIRLECGQTYFWRADEVNAAPSSTIFKGDVWSFTVEPFSYPIASATATASSSNKDMGPEKTINGSGLDGDQHSTVATDMWLSAKTGPQPTWIQYAFDRTYKLDKLWVWNSNQALESVLGFGAKDVTIEYSVDGSNWTALGAVEFAQAPGVPGSAHDTTVDFGGVAAKYVKLTIKSNWGGILPQYGLSEVRFYYVPVSAREPGPASASTGVNPQEALTWRAGREAASHKVYVSTDKQAVTDGTAAAATVASPSYEAALDLAQTYFWKVVEVNEAQTPQSWDSDVWSFSTADYLVVDDFESYTDDEGGRIYETWADGWTNNSGAQVGNLAAPFAERGTIHGGRQSMPLFYDNTKAPQYSETECTFKVPQDWTLHGITTLVAHFRGKTDNGAAPLYVKIDGKKVVYGNGAAVTALPLWKQWNIDLASVGVNLKSVKTLAVGVGDGGGKGVMYIDDICLYKSAPQVVAPADPGKTGLAVHYAMEDNVQDASGKNNHGKTFGDSSFGPGPVGKALTFNGTNAYVEVPVGSQVASWKDVTIAAFINQTDTVRMWQRAFDFGTGTTAYMFLSPNNGANGAVRFAITTAGGGGESQVTGRDRLSAGWHHVAVTIDSATMTMRLYVDGDPVATGPTTKLPADLGVTTQNWLGRSQYAADAYFTGSMDEFRIYTRALSASEVRYLAGDR